MTGFVRKATLLSACGVLAAATAMASVPSPATSVCPGCAGPGSGVPFIRVVGFQTAGGNGATAHPGSTNALTIKDFAGNPVAGSIVELNFTNCTDMRLCQYIPGGVTQTVQCPNKLIRATTNALGQVSMIALGAGLNVGLPASPTPAAPAGCIQIVADGIPLATASAVDFDVNGGAAPTSNNGMDANDLSKFTVDLFSAGYEPRADFSAFSADACGGGAADCGIVNANDLSQFSIFLFSNGSAIGCASGAGDVGVNYCP